MPVEISEQEGTKFLDIDMRAGLGIDDVGKPLKFSGNLGKLTELGGCECTQFVRPACVPCRNQETQAWA